MNKQNELHDINYDTIDLNEVIRSFFETNSLIKHQIDSYNDFIDVKIMDIINGFNPIVMRYDYNQEMDNYTYEISINISNFIINKPTIYENDGVTKEMLPEEARLRNMTYSSSIYCDVNITVINRNGSTIEVKTKNIPNLSLGKMPIMVRSKYCNLLTNYNKIIKNTMSRECEYDYGGYFIVNGSEKVVVCQERMVENECFVFKNNKISNNYSHSVEIRSVNDNVYSVPKPLSIKIVNKNANENSKSLRVSISYIKVDIPLFIVFRALGIESDREIFTHIIYDIDNKYNKNVINVLEASCEEASECLTQNMALQYIMRYLNTAGLSREIIQDDDKKIGYLNEIFRNDFLPHIGKDIKNKAIFLGYMVNKLLFCYLGMLPFDDRDNYMNKRIDNTGILLANLFRQYYGKMIKDMRNMLSREFTGGSWKSNNDFINIINNTNIYKLFKSTTIETGLKYALATGNWGLKNSSKQGIAQVLSRLNYCSTLSHLRRVNTPMEKTGKLIQPRKLHATQWGIICPAETPEGHSIGLVKNLAMSVHVTNHSDSSNVFDILNHSSHIILIKDISLRDSFYMTKIFVNGNLYAVTGDPNTLYNTLKDYKRTGVINIYTSIAQNYGLKKITINTDAGRCCRPLLIVKDGRLLLTEAHVQKLRDGSIKWYDLIHLKSYNYTFVNEPISEEGLPSSSTSSSTSSIIRRNKKYELDMDMDNQNNGLTKSVIEFLDSVEVDNAMIAMTPEDLIKNKNVNYTHCEIHPSLIFGILASFIPFPDHDQSPRVCYQSSMGKQAMGVYSSNYLNRMDTLAHVLYYPSRPMVSTNMSKYLHGDELPSGMNVVVAIASYTGYNQEDSVIMNKSAIDRGLFRSTFFRTYRDAENKNQQLSENEKFCKPDIHNTIGLKSSVYDKLNESGFIEENTYVQSGDIIIGKHLPIKNERKGFKDCSVSLRNNENGCIDKNFIGINGEGRRFCKVKVRSERIPTIGDKFSCYDKETEVLTDKGWIPFPELTMEHKVASIINDGLEYTKPLEVMSYENDMGDMYYVKSSQVDLLVTQNHRMYVSKNTPILKYDFENAWEIYNCKRKYMKNIDKFIPIKDITCENLSYKCSETGEEMDIPQQFIIKSCKEGVEDTYLNMDDWLIFFGIWIAEGCTLRDWGVSIATNKIRVKDELEKVCKSMNYVIHMHKSQLNDKIRNNWCINDKNLVNYINPLSVGSVNKNLPEWVWLLSREQCKKLIDGMCLGDGHTMVNGTRRYDTSSTKLADDFQRLCLHAGYSTNKKLRYPAGHVSIIKEGPRKGETITSTHDAFRLTIITCQNNPLVNKNIVLMNAKNAHDEIFKEFYYDNVYCCRVEGIGAIYVRRNGVPVWSGNSRHGQKGSLGIVYTSDEMPFTKNGIVPDIIINPHAIPSRMTIGQLLECLMGKVGAELGCIGDGSPFGKIRVETLSEILEKKCGYERHGNEIMYNGNTGEQIETDIFIGPTFYQRLKHMVDDKMHSRANGPMVLLTRQPAEGRSRDGGLRFGEMERDALCGETPISLTCGLSLKIKDMEVDNYNVYGWDTATKEFVASKQGGFMSKGLRECVQIKLIDGRSIICTENHRILNQENEWVYPRDLIIGYSKLNIGVTSMLIDIKEDQNNFNGWKLKLDDSIVFNTSTHDDYMRTLAFSRFLGCIVICLDKGYIYMENNIDADSIIHDIKCIFNRDVSYRTEDNSFKIDIPEDIIHVFYMIKGFSVHTIPPFILAEDCPKPIIREFLGVIFGIIGNVFPLKDHGLSLLLNIRDERKKDIFFKDIKGLLEKHYNFESHYYMNILFIHERRINILKEIGFRYSYINSFKMELFLIYNQLVNGTVLKSQIEEIYTNIKKWDTLIPTIQLTVQSVTSVGLKPVYDIGIIKTNSFLANGIVTHNCMISHGASQFLKERLMDNSDNFRVFTCNTCGIISIVNTERNRFSCKACRNYSKFSQVRIPYACKLLFQELQSMSIYLRTIT